MKSDSFSRLSVECCRQQDRVDSACIQTATEQRVRTNVSEMESLYWLTRILRRHVVGRDYIKQTEQHFFFFVENVGKYNFSLISLLIKLLPLTLSGSKPPRQLFPMCCCRHFQPS